MVATGYASSSSKAAAAAGLSEAKTATSCFVCVGREDRRDSSHEQARRAGDSAVFPNKAGDELHLLFPGKKKGLVRGFSD